MRNRRTSKTSLTVEKVFDKPERGKTYEASSPRINVGATVKAWRNDAVHCIGQVTEKDSKSDTLTVVDIDQRERYFPIRNGALTYELIKLN